MINIFSNLTQSLGVPLNGVIVNLGSFAVVQRASFSTSRRLCVACNSASILYNHREQEGEIHVNLKRLIYHQTTKSS